MTPCECMLEAHYYPGQWICVHSISFSTPWGSYNPSFRSRCYKVIIQMSISSFRVPILCWVNRGIIELSHLPKVTPQVFQPVIQCGAGTNPRYDQVLGHPSTYQPS